MDDIKYSSTHHQHEHSRTNYDDQLDYGTPASQSDAQVTLIIDDREITVPVHQLKILLLIYNNKFILFCNVSYFILR